ncbi:hypothetical protein IGJ19_000955 [Enterococcus sp. DIV1368b]|uniref:Uncharacterized protein n=1 Tax=Enterococcus mundtii TaxID=53346 RepID=A0A242KYY8_ENTMU|nr:hypothetical protein [Enterococcus mundtii]MDB7088406.1 hypothetical protein [Enterococcus mundtii]OTP26790.1 hypothetical protein A5802_000507 [Enterococcus mundtii]
MYQPIQPHHLFQQSYEEKIDYRETVLPDLADVLVCMWESIAKDILYFLV